MAHNGELCEQMVKEDVMTPLSVMLKEVSVPLPFGLLVEWGRFVCSVWQSSRSHGVDR